MKFQKFFFIALIIVLLLGSIQVGHTQAPEETQHQYFLPLFTKPEPSSSFGMAFFSSWRVPRASEANVRWVHYNGLLWSEIQPNGPVSVWKSDHADRVDRDIKAMREAGIEVILTIRSTPLWAGQKTPGYYCSPMTDINAFANFVSEVVARYSKPPFNVTYYEIWNEPDDIPVPGGQTNPYGCWGDENAPLGGGAYYAQVLKAVYPRVKSANPRAQVVLGGLLLGFDPKHSNPYLRFNRSNFFEGILTAGGGSYFDYANYHAYSAYEPGKSAIQSERDETFWPNSGGQVVGKLNYLREMMAKYNVAQKPIILSETAIIDINNKVNDYNQAFEATKADYVVWLYTRNLSKGIHVTSWYHLENYGWNKSGLLNRDNQPLPAYDAYKVMAHTLEGFTYLRDLNYPSGILGFEFTRDSQRIWVLFSEDGGQKTVNTPSGFTRAFDLFGNPVNPSGGQISFSRPTYIELTK